MDKLILLLTELEASDVKWKEYLTEDDYIPVKYIRNLLEELMITENGHVDWDNREKLLDAGWCIYPFERDGFGWLLGGLVTRKGDIVFG